MNIVCSNFLDYKSSRYYLDGMLFDGVIVIKDGDEIIGTKQVAEGQTIGKWHNPLLPNVEEVLSIDGNVLELGYKDELAPDLYNGRDFVGLAFYFSGNGKVNKIEYHYGVSLKIVDTVCFSSEGIETLIYDLIDYLDGEEINHIHYQYNSDVRNIRPFFFSKWKDGKLSKSINLSTSLGSFSCKNDIFNHFDSLYFKKADGLIKEREISYLLASKLNYPFKIKNFTDLLKIEFLFGEGMSEKFIAGKTLNFDTDLDGVIEVIDFSRCEELTLHNIKLLNLVFDHFSFFPRLKVLRLSAVGWPEKILLENPDVAQLIEQNKSFVDIYLNGRKL